MANLVLSPAALLAAALMLPALAPAQSPQRIIGLTRVTPTVLSQDFNTCAPAQCPPFGFPPPAGPFVGGSAYDPITRGLWISEGLLIAKVDPRNQCTFQCPPMPMPNTSPNNPVTGLAFNESTRTLWVTDLSGIIRWYKVGGPCQLSLANRCIAPIPVGDVLTGCATDDPGGLIYYCSVTPGAPGGIVYIAKQSSPCNPFCKFPVMSCGGNPIGPLQGLAYDACKQTLWATDGKNSVRLAVNASTCMVNEVQCCPNPTPEPYVGLCVLPSTEASTGTSCTGSTCPSCPSMQHTISGDPVIGNPGFAWNLINAPANEMAILLLNPGPCTSPGILLPGFCGPILVSVPPAPAFIGPFPTGGGFGCTGNISLPFPIPPNPALCGITISSQWVGWCLSTGALGTFVSNCLSITISAT